MTRPALLAALVLDALTFSVGYILFGRWATGGGVVEPSLYFEAATDEARWTVLGALAVGVIAVLAWRAGYHLTRHLLAKTLQPSHE